MILRALLLLACSACVASAQTMQAHHRAAAAVGQYSSVPFPSFKADVLVWYHCASNQVVSGTLTDKSGRGNHGTKQSGASMTYSLYDGKDCAYFDGTGDWYNIGGGGNACPSSAFTVIVIGTRSVGGTQSGPYLLSEYNNANWDQVTCICRDEGATARSSMTVYNNGSAVANAASTGNNTPDTTSITMWAWTLKTNEAWVWSSVGGVRSKGGTDTSCAWSASSPTAHLFGARATSAGYAHIGYLSEFMLVNRALTETELIEVANYFGL